MSSPYSGLYLKSYYNTIEHKFINHFVGQNVINNEAKTYEMTEEEDNGIEEKKSKEVDDWINCQTDTEYYPIHKKVMQKRSSKVVYAKNSFDRFGDNLTELILQYLTFEDKVRLECVSKQCRRLVFNKQFEIDLNNSFEGKNSLKRLRSSHGFRDDDQKLIDRQLLESLLKKCPNISRVKLLIETSVKEDESLELITKY